MIALRLMLIGRVPCWSIPSTSRVAYHEQIGLDSALVRQRRQQRQVLNSQQRNRERLPQKAADGNEKRSELQEGESFEQSPLFRYWKLMDKLIAKRRRDITSGSDRSRQRPIASFSIEENLSQVDRMNTFEARKFLLRHASDITDMIINGVTGARRQEQIGIVDRVERLFDKVYQLRPGVPPWNLQKRMEFLLARMTCRQRIDYKALFLYYVRLRQMNDDARRRFVLYAFSGGDLEGGEYLLRRAQREITAVPMFTPNEFDFLLEGVWNGCMFWGTLLTGMLYAYTLHGRHYKAAEIEKKMRASPNGYTMEARGRRVEAYAMRNDFARIRAEKETWIGERVRMEGGVLIDTILSLAECEDEGRFKVRREDAEWLLNWFNAIPTQWYDFEILVTNLARYRHWWRRAFWLSMNRESVVHIVRGEQGQRGLSFVVYAAVQSGVASMQQVVEEVRRNCPTPTTASELANSPLEKVVRASVRMLSDSFSGTVHGCDDDTVIDAYTAWFSPVAGCMSLE